MKGSKAIRVRSRGTITLPIEFRQKYGITDGDLISLLDLGDGAFLITPIKTQVDRWGDRVAKAMDEVGVSKDEIIAALDEERERYYQERYLED
jgi:bifunctional DNA-binding transcriptional regulator/antitoxin component of YhaV-PrlF toxin-antitoxin module